MLTGSLAFWACLAAAGAVFAVLAVRDLGPDLKDTEREHDL